MGGEKSLTQGQNVVRFMTYVKVWTFLCGILGFFYIFGCSEWATPFSLVSNSKGTEGEISELKLNDTQLKELRDLGLSTRNPIVISTKSGSKTIHGRFLHITDMHPDPFYKEGSNVDRACHSGDGKAGKYGDAILGCDSPMVLMYDTIKWIQDNLKDKIDFIVWTGDNIRHDNDRKYPRKEMDIFDMNEKVSELMFHTFKDENSADPSKMLFPIIPSLGNNDVYPHNLFAPGPTLQTREFFRIWKNFVPQVQLHTFSMGVYFFQEVIPDQLAVISLNTLYFFRSNPLVDNCDNKKEPGYKMFEWLGYTLKELRARSMKVWITGHVPPNLKNYDNSCLRKYVAWVHQYRDVVIGGLFGHMNIDHFIPFDSVKAYRSINKKFKDIDYRDSRGTIGSYYDEAEDSDDEEENMCDLYDDISDEHYHATGGIPNKKVSYMNSLRDSMYSRVKGRKKSGHLSERYIVSHVSTSVVPTFNPGLRVWEYNITGIDPGKAFEFEPWDNFFKALSKHIEWELHSDLQADALSKKKKNIAKKRDKSFPVPGGYKYNLGPAYVPQTFTPTKYVNYFADLDSINQGIKPFGYELEYKTDDNIYDMKDLTVNSWIRLARILGKPLKDKRKKEKKKEGIPLKVEAFNQTRDYKYESEKKAKNYEKENLVWRHFLKYSFVNSDYENKGYG